MPVIAGLVPEGPNVPKNLVHVLRTAATLRGLPEAGLAAQTWTNARRLFG